MPESDSPAISRPLFLSIINYDIFEGDIMTLLTLQNALALLFMAAPNLHAATGTYIDCVHGYPDLIDCNNCCNETFSGILRPCDARRDQCEALCPPGVMYCLDACEMFRGDCLMQDRRDFDCPHWKAGCQIA